MKNNIKHTFLIIKNNHRFVVNAIIIVLFTIVSILALIVYAIKDDLSEVYEAFIPLAITGLACIILNKINTEEEEETK
ncbi:hypothetical protein [Niallia taxi]|uniref:hypothetical protein n=1 Tax=Niallia taxi TaxID=2499688 RepID=UPI0025504E10|nr:hypothetical protein [Niallia taxi]MDK8641671.1 hypothetical protein [Niallia taxi]